MRTILIWIAFGMLLASCSWSDSTVVFPEQDTKQAPIKILFGSAELGSEAIVESIQRYEQLTGESIEVQTFSHGNIQAKVYNELIQQSDTFDLILLNAAWIPLIINHLEPLSSYLLNDEYEDPMLDDFLAKIVSDGSLFNQEQISLMLAPDELGTIEENISRGFEYYTLPMASSVLMGTYREDLFKDRLIREAYSTRYGDELALPYTLEKFEELNSFFTTELDSSINRGIAYGSTFMAGEAEASFIEYTSVLNALGGSLYTEDMLPNLLSEQAIDALQLYEKWVRVSADSSSDILNFGWEEAAIAFKSGQAAMGMNFHKMELSSDIRTGKLNYFMFPFQNEKGSGPYLVTWGLAINKYSEQKQRAYRLMQYLSSSSEQINALKYKNQVTRQSAFLASDKLMVEQNRNYYDVLQASIEGAQLRPRMKYYSQMVEIIGAAISSYFNSNISAEQALEEAQDELLKLRSP